MIWYDYWWSRLKMALKVLNWRMKTSWTEHSTPEKCSYSSSRCNHACLSSSVQGGCHRGAGGRAVVDPCILILCPVNSLSLCALSAMCTMYLRLLNRTTLTTVHCVVCSTTLIYIVVKNCTVMNPKSQAVHTIQCITSSTVNYIEIQYMTLRYAVQ